MENLEGFDFIALTFNGDGKATTNALGELQQFLATSGTTDLLVMAHGFRNSEQEARTLYGNFLHNFKTHLARPEFAGVLDARRYAMAGVFWPSKAFKEGPEDGEGHTQGVGDGDKWAAVRAQLEGLKDADMTAEQRQAIDQAATMLESLEGDTAQQDAFGDLLKTLLVADDPDTDDGQAVFVAKSGSELLRDIGGSTIVARRRDDDSDGGTMSVGGGVGGGAGDGETQGIGNLFQTITGKVGSVLNGASWYIMKNRAGTVGANGVAPSVRTLKAALPALRVHLIGHSLGGRCMAATAKSLSNPPMVQPDSVSLLEAAFSHYGFSDNNGDGKPGFFREVIARRVVRGPLISTWSEQDSVVGYAYSIASRLDRDNTKAIGDANDKYGGIGRNGTQKTAEKKDFPLEPVGTRYAFALDVVNNVNGSGGGITNHSDITNPKVTYAVACAIALT